MGLLAGQLAPHLEFVRERKPGPGAFTGIVEADETYFLESRKGSREWTRVSIGNPIPWSLATLFPALGLCRAPRRRGGTATKRGLSRQQVPVLVARDRSGVTTDAVLMRADAASVAAVLGPILKPRETLLCTDSARIYRAFAQAAGVAHRPVNQRAGQRVRQGVFHIQNVNAYHGRLKGWMRRFKGVSTRYLANYLGWRRLLDCEGATLTPEVWLQRAVG